MSLLLDMLRLPEQALRNIGSEHGFLGEEEIVMSPAELVGKMLARAFALSMMQQLEQGVMLAKQGKKEEKHG